MTGITDDIVVHGKDDKEHDKHLHKFMSVTHEHGLVFIKDKCAVKQTSTVFFRCVYDANGAHPDPEKVSPVHIDASTQDSNSTTEVPQCGNLSVTLHTLTFLLHYTLTCDPLKKGKRAHMEQIPIRKHLTKSNQWFARIPHLHGTSMSASLSLSKLMHPKKALGAALPSR